ncbi:MAG TPA: NAD(P)H-hydrate dehydratase [Myxococcota bacterium]|jgi:NAD(P)H-hydrate epimerase|nr:NAD(P)H-hydrate dehydratase [Myxococcota bacterium]
MARLPGNEWPLVGADAMRALDRHTIEKLGVPAELLMECAGRAVAAFAEAELAAGGRVHVLCGPGNNGGDGLVAARHLHLRGVPVAVAFAGDPGRASGDAARNLERAERVGVAFGRARFEVEPGDVVVDALFGTGLARAPEGEAAALIERANAARPQARVVAVDVPSGLDADTGQPLGPCIEADVTVSLALPKLGLALEPGRSRAGRIFVARIGIADHAPGADATAGLLTRRGAGALLPARPASGHKGTFGHVLVVAGSRGKAGAAALAASGAARAGAGLVTVACPSSVRSEVAVQCAEAMTVALAESRDGELAPEAVPSLVELAHARSALAVGPGLGRGDGVREALRNALGAIERPVVVDADGLVAFADALELLRTRPAPTILTPHPGEAALLLGSTADALNRDRIGAARALAERTGAVAVLKGAATVVAAPNGRVRVNPTGGPALATGGTGDVLAGVAAALLAQGLEAFDAASVAVYLHGLAGDLVAAAIGPSGALAGDVARHLPRAGALLRAAAKASDERAVQGPGGVDALAFPERG